MTSHRSSGSSSSVSHDAVLPVAIDEKTAPSSVTIQETSSHDGALHESQQATESTRAGTLRGIHSLQALLICIGGTVGTGLFVGSAQALAIGGPALLFTAFSLTLFLVFGVITAVLEPATYLPVTGCSMSYFAGRFVSPSLGYALGWTHFLAFAIIANCEVTATSILIDFWANDVPRAVWITIMLAVIVIFNQCKVGLFANTEAVFAGAKTLMIVGLLVFVLIATSGGNPSGHSIGFRYWTADNAWKPYILAGASGRAISFMYIWVFATFSFIFGPELVVYTSAEMVDPRKNLPKAARGFFGGLFIFYALGSLAIGIICDPTAKDLTSSAGNVNASPWVIAIRQMGVSTLPGIINVGVIICALSSANAYVYMSSRTLYSLAEAGNGPKVFARCNRYGVPYIAVTASSVLLLLSYLSVGSGTGQVFNWLVSMSNTGAFISWIVCCVVQIRFRKACTAQGIEVPYRSRLQPYAAYACIPFFALMLLLNGFTNFLPGHFSGTGFGTSYAGIVVFLALWLGRKLTAGRHDAWMIGSGEMDLRSGLDELEAHEHALQDQPTSRPRSSNSGRWRRVQAVLKRRRPSDT